MANEIDVYKEWLGIPEGDRPPDYYTLLRLVQFEDDPDKIQNNYRRLNAHVRKYATGQYLLRSQELLNELAKAMLCLTDGDSKQEYDASLGREPQESDSDEPRTVLEFLVSHGQLKRSQISEIEHFAEARGLSHRDAVIQMKLVEPQDATRAYAAELRLSCIDLDDMLPEDDVLDQIPRRIVKRHSCLPLFEDRGRILVACTDEPLPELEDEIRLRFGMPMRAVLAVPRSIQQAIAKYYAPGARSEPSEAAAAAKSSANGGKKSDPGKAKDKEKKAAPTKKGRLSDEELLQRRNISLLVTGWVTIGTTLGLNLGGLVTNSVVGPLVGLVAGGITLGVLKLTYWTR
ncbi:MAG: general secretion pathway protein GspE [Planctomycetaceae bacterium]|nr:general secretion pathway protein GspE [Planctomycetaceae bacterium]